MKLLKHLHFPQQDRDKRYQKQQFAITDATALRVHVMTLWRLV